MSKQKEWVITGDHDAIWARMQAIKLAKAAGFSSQASWSIGTALSELVTNAIKFAKGGKFSMIVHQHTFEIVVEDEGPGIEDIPSALVDGFSEGAVIPPGKRARGLGSGLGAVKRLMDELIIKNKKSGGLHVRALKHL